MNDAEEMLPWFEPLVYEILLKDTFSGMGGPAVEQHDSDSGAFGS